ncbi:MAG: hypothetical protein Q9169_004080 [Polycauliona sp. 2 TL-2023]
MNDILKLQQPPSWYTQTYSDIKARVRSLWAQSLRGPKRILRQPTLEAQKEDPKPKSSQPSPRSWRHPWTLSHGFYATMGGFAMDVPRNLSPSQEFMPATADEFRFVTPIALEILAHASPNEVPNLSAKEVASKSKADVLTKILTCVQALWFIAQCLTRRNFWWDKPFDVEYPTLLDGPTLRQIRALTYMLDHESLKSTTGWNPTNHNILRLGDSPKNDRPITETKTRILGEVLAARHGASSMGSRENGLYYDKFRKFLLGSINTSLLNPEEDIEYKRQWQMVGHLELTSKDVTRWRMALNFTEIVEKYIDPSRYSLFRRAMIRRYRNWPATNDVFVNIRIIAGLTSAALIYGGLHALAWFTHFPSATEQLLWRIAVGVVMGGMPVMAIAVSTWRRTQSTARLGFRGYCFMLLFFIMLAFYAVARAFLLVECFINVAHLPPGVYEVPEWTRYLSLFT